MQWIFCTDQNQAVDDLSRRLEKELAAGESVVWLLSGGSNIEASVKVMSRLPDTVTKNLTISLVDERYGPPGHPDSNWTRLEHAGFNTRQATMLPVLTTGLDFAATARHFETMLNHMIVPGRIVVAQLGIGDDSHIAGLLPNSPGTTDSDTLVAAYHSDKYDRISLTFEALRCVTAAYTLAFGPSKKPALAQLATETAELADQPAQILKQLHEAYVYNDQIEETK